ncbi:MAG TPA: deoxyribonuclease IV [Isosphaeraceae bacterium]|jgi:deoxyribonuclease-4|nr:deoxyribonuclease IV [Isosphaeraceae bacterium]
MRRLFGAHMSIAGGHDRAVFAASKVGGTTVQLFTKNNNQWRARPIDDARVAAFRSALAATGVERPVAHNSYLINLGSPAAELWEKSIAAMVDELERAEALGIVGVVAHPGAHVGSGEEEGLRRIAAGIDEVHRRARGLEAQIWLETTAGQGTCLGHRVEHLGAILEKVAAPERLGICADTCHLFAAGYPLEPAEQYNETIAAIERAVGPGRVRVWHLNDSLRERGSRVDRHAGIGRGRMGLEPFRLLVNDPRFAATPMVLETPKGTEAGEDLDAIHLRTLRRLLAADDAAEPLRPDRPSPRTRTVPAE